MTIDMPHLDFPLFVEVTSAINDFSFMPIHDIKITSTGSNIGMASDGNLTPTPQYTKSSNDLTFYDSGTLDFKNLTVGYLKCAFFKFLFVFSPFYLFFLFLFFS
jgi:hypothetical protein